MSSVVSVLLLLLGISVFDVVASYFVTSSEQWQSWFVCASWRCLSLVLPQGVGVIVELCPYFNVHYCICLIYHKNTCTPSVPVPLSFLLALIDRNSLSEIVYLFLSLL